MDDPGAAALALALAGCGGGAGNNAAAVVSNAPLPQIAAPNGGDWTQTIDPHRGGRLPARQSRTRR